jgi:hypothetical protein
MEKRYYLYFLAMALLVLGYFANSHKQALMADEPTRAIVAAEIMLRGNPIPTINNEIYLNKPPLYNWLLIPFYKILGFTEFATRLPAILSLLVLGYLVFYYLKKFTEDVQTSFFVAMAFLTGGNILFYSSLLGHIDATFSILIFVLLMLSYALGKDNLWNSLFKWSYIICFFGFMLKGIPALVFVAVTLMVAAFFFKRFKILFSSLHFLNMLWFFVPLAIYLWVFSYYYSLDAYINNLWAESSKRTVLEKSLLESVLHIFQFPVQFIVDTAPWSFLLLIFVKKECRIFVKNNEFLRYLVWLFLANIAIYWLAPDNRARYVMMLYPLFLAVILFTFQNVDFWKKTWTDVFFRWFPASLPILFVGAYFTNKEVIGLYYHPWLILLIGSFSLVALAFSKYKRSFFPLLFMLLFIRLAFDFIVIPDRIKVADGTREKLEATEISAITANSKLTLLHSNLHHSSTFYLTTMRQQLLPVHTDKNSCDTSSYYLIPTDLITDLENTSIYYNFYRVFEHKQFSLVKFKKDFPRTK